MRKIYGESKIDRCPFCEKSALLKNKQGVSVCKDHKDKQLGEMKCACGRWLDLKQGKWGPFFTCINCGCISMRKAIDMNPPLPIINKQDINIQNIKKASSKEINITSDDLDFM